MLVKKELLTIPADEPSVQFVDLPKSGRVLAVYCDERGKKPVRFFSDGKNYTFLFEGEWNRTNLFDIYGARRSSQLPDEIDRNEEIVKLVDEFLNLNNRYAHSVISEIDSFIRNRNWEKRLQTLDAKHRLLEEHFAMFPELPEDFTEWAEQRLFTEKYLFFSNKQKNKRRIRCSKCGAEYETKENIRHKTEGYCEECGTRAVYFAARYRDSIKNKNNVCFCSKNGTVHLFETFEVERRYDEELMPYYIPDSIEKLLYFPENTKKQIYRYQYKNIWGQGSGWYRAIDEGSTKEAVVYDRNLFEMLPGRYAKDISRLLFGYHKGLNIVNLILNLERIPETEYLLKMGMIQLARQSHRIAFEHGKGFAGVMGVPGHYKKLYSRLDITLEEHNLIKKAKYIVKEENIRQIRKYNLWPYNLTRLAEQFSMDKILNYLERASKHNKRRRINELLQLWNDYMDLMGQMDVLTPQNMFPQDIEKEHDRIVQLRDMKKREEEREKREKEAKEFAQKHQQFAKMAARCKSKELMIKVAATDDELIREGAALHHCVGGGSYWRRQIDGYCLICFIRKREDEDTPYFTLEINLKGSDGYSISQLYGYGNCKPSEEIRRFAQRFVNMIQPKEALQPTGT